MRSILQDLRSAFRSLLRAPASTAISIAILALAIGGTTTLWQALEATVLRPLPYPEASRLMTLFDLHDGTPWTVSPSNFVDYRDQSKSFESMAAYAEGSFALSGRESSAEQVVGATVTADFFRSLRLDAEQGRTLGAGDDQENVVVLSHEIWASRYGSDPSLVGRTIRVDGAARTVVGIVPAGRGFPLDSRLWVPLAFSEEALRTQRGAHYLGVIGRLAEGVSIEQADAELRGIAARLAATYPRTNEKISTRLRVLQDWVVRNSRKTLALMFGAVVLALLAACANLANLSLARAVARSRELALKSALGAGAGRLARVLALENFLLAAAGALAGAALTAGAVHALPTLLGDLPRLESLRFDRAGAAALALVGGIAGLLVGFAPATFALHREPAEALRTGGRGLAGAHGAGRMRRLLVVVTTALALVLVAGASLLVRSYRSIAAVDPGFSAGGRLTFSVSLPSSQYAKPEDLARFTSELEGRLRSLPGVEHVGAIFGQLFSDFGYGISLKELDGLALPDDDDRRSPQIRFVTPDYFATLGIPLASGRLFADGDRFGAPNVVIANQSAARLIFESDAALGHTLAISTTNGLGRGQVRGEVVGVVGDVRDQNLDDEPAPTLYFVQDQFPVDFLTFVVRADAARLDRLVAPIRSTVSEMNPDLPIFSVRTLDQLMAGSLATRRTLARLLSGFALLAVTLAALGLFGILSQSVTEQRRELAVRSALGATPARLAAQVLREAGLLAAFGLALGLATALALSRYLASALYRLSPSDPGTYATSSLLLLAVALVAAWLPAVRALRLDPIVALRDE